MNDAVETTVSSVLDDAFPGREVEEVSSAGISWNVLNETVAVDLADGETAFLKVAVDGDGSRITRECAVIDYVDAHCDVDVPSVIASGTAGETPYLATAPMGERTLAAAWEDMRSDDERASAVRDVGAALAAIHSSSFERHGHVVGGGAEELVLDDGTWTDVLVEIVQFKRTLASTDRFDHYVDEVAWAVETNRDRLDDAPAALVHGDPAQPNVFRDGTSVGFIDWEIAHVGDPARELHRAEEQLLYDGAGELRTALQEGYERRAGSLPDGAADRAPVYDAVWHLGTLTSFDKWVEMRDEPPADAAESAAAEMDDYLEAIR